MNTFQIPEANLSTLKARIEKLAKRASRLKLNGPVLNVLESHQVEVKIQGELPYFRTLYTVTLTGVGVVKLNGWTLAAVLDAQYNEDGTLAGNILRAVPSAPPVPTSYRTAPSNCDHCRTARRRNSTILVVNEEGVWKQVGSDCIKDFLGHASAEAYAELAQIILDARDLAEASEDDDDWGSGGSRGARKYAIDDILQVAASAVRLYGWRSNKVAQEFGGQSTSGMVSGWVNSDAKQRKEWKHALAPDATDISLASNVREWLSSLSSRRELNDYMYNLSLMGSTEVVTPRNFGILCAAIVTYSKEQERESNRRKKFEDDLKSVYVGQVGVRQLFPNLTVAFVTEFGTNFGVTHLYKFRDEAGNIIVWFSSNSMGWEQGQVISLVASVKSHKEYKGVKQTAITRAKEPVAPPTEEEKKAKKEKAKREKPLRLAERIGYRVSRSNADAWYIMCDIVKQLKAELQ